MASRFVLRARVRCGAPALLTSCGGAGVRGLLLRSATKPQRHSCGRSSSIARSPQNRRLRSKDEDRRKNLLVLRCLLGGSPKVCESQGMTMTIYQRFSMILSPTVSLLLTLATAATSRAEPVELRPALVERNGVYGVE